MRRRALAFHIGGLITALVVATQATAFDFDALKNAVRKMDIDKVVDIGKRVVESTNEMTVEQEIELGNELAARLFGAMQPLDDPRVQRYVNHVGRWLTLQTERADLPWRFTVTATDSVGAFAVPGGHIIVTAGLVRLLRNEDELAGVLGHEIVHVVERHHVKAIMKRARLAIAKDVAADLAAEYVSKNPLVTDTLMNAGMDLYTSGLDQADELQADTAGGLLAARSGYDPLGLLMVLSTLDSIDQQEPRMAVFFSTHPPGRERIDHIAADAEDASMALGSLLKNEDRFAQVQSRLF